WTRPQKRTKSGSWLAILLISTDSPGKFSRQLSPKRWGSSFATWLTASWKRALIYTPPTVKALSRFLDSPAALPTSLRKPCVSPSIWLRMFVNSGRLMEKLLETAMSSEERRVGKGRRARRCEETD